LSLFAKEKVLVAFGKRGNLNTTATLSNHGVQLAIASNLKEKDNLEFVYVDIGDSVIETTKAIEEAVVKHKPVAIIGAITSNKAFIISEIAERNKVLFITPYATNSKLTQDKNYTFRTCFDDNYQGKKLAEFVAKDLKLKTGIALVNKKMSYAIGIAKVFGENIDKLGGKSEVVYFMDTDALDEKQIAKIAAKKPEFIFLPSYQIEAATIISLIGKSLPNTTFVGPDSWGGGRMFHNIMKTSKTQFVGYYSQHWSYDYNSPLNNKIKKVLGSNLVDKDMRFTSTSMNAPIAIGFELTEFFIALNRYAKKKNLELNKAIRSFKFNSIAGPIQLKDSSNTAKKPLFIFKISNTSESFLKGFN
jgi:branched-chain amino acid transport system substrate-binding protein